MALSLLQGPVSYNLSMHSSASSTFFRPGGRTPSQLRPLTLTPGFVQTAEGSVLVSLGNTRVLTCATMEQGVPGWLRNSGRGWVTAEYSMLPRVDGDPDAAGEREGQDRRANARNSAADRPEPALGGGHEGAGGANRDSGLRRDSGRRRARARRPSPARRWRWRWR